MLKVIQQRPEEHKGPKLAPERKIIIEGKIIRKDDDGIVLKDMVIEKKQRSIDFFLCLYVFPV